MKLVERTAYLDELKDLLLTPDIKVITGVRRSGKSKLMDALADWLQANDPQANIIHVNFNLTDFENLLEYHALEAYVEDHYLEEKNNYLMVDEVLMCPSFEKAINSLHAKEKYDIYVTGSNAFLQSSDLATLFVGRTYEVHIYPFSFRPLSADSQNITGDCLCIQLQPDQFTGMRGALHRLTFRIPHSQNTGSNIRLRNARAKYALLPVWILNTSWHGKNYQFAMNGQTHKTVGKYMDALCKAFAFYRIRRYDIKGKRYLRSEDKYYLVDQSFRFARLGTRNMDYGRVLENIVAVELLRRGYEVYVGVLYKKEIDFVAMRQGEKLYIQVANDITDPKTFERETTPLLSIKDAYPKLLIARTWQPEYQYEGIRIIDAADWLAHPVPQK